MPSTPTTPEPTPVAVAAAGRRRDGGLLSAAGAVFAGNVIARALGFLYPVVLAHAVSKGEFGLVYFFIGTGFFVGELVLAGFPGALTRFLAAHPEDSQWITAALNGGLPLLLVSLAVGESVAALTSSPPGLMSAVVVGLTIDAYYFSLLRGLGRFRLLAGYRVTANAAQLVLVLIAVRLDVIGLELAVIIYSFAYLVPIAAIEWRTGLLAERVPRRLRASAEHRRTLTRWAIPALISGTAYAALTQLGVFYIKVLSPEALAGYAAAYSLAQPMLLVSFAVGVVLMPRVAAADRERQIAILTKGLAVSIGTGLLAVVGYLLLAGPVVDAVLPASFDDAKQPLPYLAVALGLIGTYTVLSQWWLGRNRPRPPATTLTIAALITAVLQLLLTPSHGAVGAGVALIVGGSFALVTLGAITWRELGGRRAAAVSPGSTG